MATIQEEALTNFEDRKRRKAVEYLELLYRNIDNYKRNIEDKNRLITETEKIISEFTVDKYISVDYCTATTSNF